MNDDASTSPEVDELAQEVALIASARSMEVGGELVRYDRVGYAVLGMMEAGAELEDVMAGLVMAGVIEHRHTFLRRLPVVRRLVRHALPYRLRIDVGS